MRNLSSLLILREVMGPVEEQERRINPEAKSGADFPLVNCLPDQQPTPSAGGSRSVPGYPPYHYFDYVLGTSTGGLIAILLGRLRMSVDEAIEECKKFSAKEFRKSASPWRRLLTKHDNTEKRAQVQDHSVQNEKQRR